MDSRFDHYWLTPWPQSKLRTALFVSMGLHVAIGLVVVQLFEHQTKVRPPEVLQVSFFSPPTPEPPKEVKVAAVTKPEPKKPEPEPKKPKPVPKKPKPVPKKTTPKPKKVVPKKTEPKKPKPEPKPVIEPEKTIVAKSDPTPKAPKVSATEALPSELGSWGRRVQLKVERIWTPPPGIRLGDGEMEAEIEFWVDRNGNLVGEPIVIRHATNRLLGDSGVHAIRLAGTPRFPPLPATFTKLKQRVVYAFTLAR